jgi:hypothetical protein
MLQRVELQALSEANMDADISFSLGISFALTPDPDPILPAPVLVWGGHQLNLTPDWSITLTAPEIDDSVTMYRSTSEDFSTYTTASSSITATAPLNALTFNFGGAWAIGVWYVKLRVTRGSAVSFFSNAETVDLYQPSTSGNSLVKEDGISFILLEDGSNILLEAA